MPFLPSAARSTSSSALATRSPKVALRSAIANASLDDAASADWSQMTAWLELYSRGGVAM
eukprot:6480713-Amphidinium_carterae.3